MLGRQFDIQSLSPQELATRLKKPDTFVDKLERAEAAITSAILEDCASALGLSLAELVKLALSAER